MPDRLEQELPGTAPGLSAIARLGIVAWVALALLIVFAQAMTQPVTYDEDQYVAAGVLAMHALPYRDFAYLQSPLDPFVLAGLFRLTGGWFLLSARLLTFGLAVGSGLALWALLRRLGSGVALALVLLTACVMSPFLASPLANARNDALPLFLMLAGLWLYIWAVDRSWWGRAGAALLFGLAVEAKVSYLFGPLVLGLHALAVPRLRLPPYALGSAVAALPLLACWWVAPEAVRFGLLDYHLSAPASWYGTQGMAVALTPWVRLEALANWSSFGGNLTLIGLCVALALLAIARHRKWKRPGPVLLSMVVGAGVLGFLPSPAWSMYYAAVAPLLACCAAHLHRTTAALAGAASRRILVLVAAMPLLLSLMVQAPEVKRVFQLSNWAGVVAHRSAEAIQALLPGGGTVATLYPTMVIDANPILPGLATGPFLFRSGTLYPPEKLRALHAIAPPTMAEAFARDRPAAIYAGLYGAAWAVPMDAALTAYAQAEGWHVVRTDEQGGRLWVP